MTFSILHEVTDLLPFHLDDTEQVNQAFARWRKSKTAGDKRLVDTWTYCYIYRYFLVKLASSTSTKTLTLDRLVANAFDDRAGTDPTTPNSQFRGLAGYERELFPKFQMGLQYYLEYTLKHDQLVTNSYWPQYEQNRFRHVLTLRLTQLLVMDKLELSLFTFFSPDELDTYIRPRITYKIIDPLAFVVGANLMFGRDDYTFFGQLQENTNVYVRLRYSF